MAPTSWKYPPRPAEGADHDILVVEDALTETEARIRRLAQRTGVLKDLNRLAAIARGVVDGEWTLEFDPRSYGWLIRAISKDLV